MDKQEILKNLSELTAAKVNDEHFDVIVMCLQNSIREDAWRIEQLRRKGHKKNAAMISSLGEDAENKLAAIDFIKQQGWEPTADFPDQSHHWAGIFETV